MNIADISKKYCLHDCIIDKAYIQDSKLTFRFADGIYERVNETANKSSPCTMDILIKDLDIDSVNIHIVITEFRGNKHREISFANLQKMLKQSALSVYLDFYSCFCNGLLLKCIFPNCEIEMQITEIEDIGFNGNLKES